MTSKNGDVMLSGNIERDCGARHWDAVSLRKGESLVTEAMRGTLPEYWGIRGLISASCETGIALWTRHTLCFDFVLWTSFKRA